MEKDQVWKAVLGELEVSLSKANFTTWFKNTQIILVDGEAVTIAVPNVFTKEWLEKKYHTQIVDALRHVLPSVGKVEYKVGSPKALEEEAVKSFAEDDRIKKIEKEVVQEEEKEDKRVALGDLNPKYNLETFVVGNSNKLTFAACQSVAENPGTKYNPLFIYGGVGLGKTHLMQAVGNAIVKKDPKKKIVYVTSEKFTNDFISSITDKKNQWI